MLAHMLYHFLTRSVCFLRSIFCLFFSTLFSRLHFARSLSGNSSLSTFYFVLRISQIIRFTLPRVLRVIFFHNLRFQASCFILHYARYISHFRFAAISITFLISHFVFLLPSFYLQLLLTFSSFSLPLSAIGHTVSTFISHPNLHFRIQSNLTFCST